MMALVCILLIFNEFSNPETPVVSFSLEHHHSVPRKNYDYIVMPVLRGSSLQFVFADLVLQT